MTDASGTPRITVVLPVYNGEKYVAEAIRSVLDQSCGDFELLAIDDGSTDRTPQILADFRDSRVRLLRIPTNRGIVAALNLGIAQSKSELIARMDADDICLPLRLERQAAFLDAHPETAICGTWTEEFGVRSGACRMPHWPEEVVARLFFGFAVYHPTLMMRRAFLEKHALAYRQGFSRAEDFDLLIRAAEFAPPANVPEILLLYRTHEEQETAVHHAECWESTERLLAQQLRRLDPAVTAAEESFHIRVVRGRIAESELPQAEQWLLRLGAVNRKNGRYDRNAFERELRRQWFCLHEAVGQLTMLLSYWPSSLAALRGIGLRRLQDPVRPIPESSPRLPAERPLTEPMTGPLTEPARAPRITVVLPVYNGEAFLAEAIRSVLAQTFTDFELLAIDDGSTDGTPEILAALTDPRLRVIRFPENRGRVAALNAGLAASQSELIARMDADDICLPQRFERQVAFLEEHLETAICGTWAEDFGAHSKIHRLPSQPEDVAVRLFFGFAMYHPTWMMRRASLEGHGLTYRTGFADAEDLDFLIRAAEFAPLANVPDVLLRYRAHDRQATELHKPELIEAAERLRIRQLRRLLPGATPLEVALHIAVLREQVPEADLRPAGRWLLRLQDANRRTPRYHRNAFESELRRQWYRIHDNLGFWSPTVLLSFWSNPLAWDRKIDWGPHKIHFDECLFPPFQAPRRNATASGSSRPQAAG